MPNGNTFLAPTALQAALQAESGGSNGVTFDSTIGELVGTDRPNLLRGSDQSETLRGLGGHDVMFGGGGDDWLDGGDGKDRMVGGQGNDSYLVTDAADQVVERPGEGVDSILTTISFDLPDNIENLSVYGPGGSGLMVLRGNAHDNVIIGAPFSYEEIYGLDGNDILDGGGRVGGFLDGGNGNDRLLVSFGELKGGPGADTFVAAGRGAHTSPDVPITILDFNAAEGDRIEIHETESYPAADLFASGALRFDPLTNTLTLDLDPSTTSPTSVDQVVILVGVETFDPSWVTVGPSL